MKVYMDSYRFSSISHRVVYYNLYSQYVDSSSKANNEKESRNQTVLLLGNISINDITSYGQSCFFTQSFGNGFSYGDK